MEGDVLAFAQVMVVCITSLGALIGIGLGTRILWRLGSPKPRALESQHDADRQARLEQAVEAIAIEVERISEAQRFMVGLLSESPALRRPERTELAAPDRAGRVITPH